MTPPAAPQGFTAEQTTEFALLWSSPASSRWTRRSDQRAVRVLAELRAQGRTTAAQRAQRRRLEVQIGLFVPGADVEALLDEQDWLARREVARRAVGGPVEGRVEVDEDEGVRA